MSEPTKTRHTNSRKTIVISFSIPGKEDISLILPATASNKRKIDQLKKFLQKKTTEPTDWDSLITPWEEATPWEELAEKRIKKYTKAGIVLRGARLREGISQKDLAKRCGISQENLSKMENGKRAIGKQTAKKIAKALRISPSLLLLSGLN